MDFETNQRNVSSQPPQRRPEGYLEPISGLSTSPELIKLDEDPPSRPPPSPAFEREETVQEVLTDGEQSMELASPLLPFAVLGEGSHVDVGVDELVRADSEEFAGEESQALDGDIRMIRPRVSSSPIK